VNEYHHIYYEDLCEEPLFYIKKLLFYLEINLKDEIILEATRIASANNKIMKHPLSNVCKNFLIKNILP
jgi:hypothetical protein